MIAALSGLLLLLMILTPLTGLWLLGRRQDPRQTDLLRPVNIVTGLALLNVPYFFVVAFNPEAIPEWVRGSQWVGDVDQAIALYAILEGLGFWFYWIGIRSGMARRITRKLPVVASNGSNRRVRLAAILAGAIGLIIYAYFIYRIGGLVNLWLNLRYRTRITAGTGYIGFTYWTLLVLSVMFAVYALGRAPSRRRAIVVVGWSLVVAAILGSTGGRSGPLMLLLLAVLTWHYGIRRIERIVRPRYVGVGMVVVFFIAAMPLFRTQGAVEVYGANPENLLKDAVENLENVPGRLSSIDRHLITVSYFTPERLWWGRSYIDLAFAPIPRSFYPDKPPIDEGLYLRTIAEGRPVRPPMPADDLSITSWPPGKYGMFMNYWIPGYILGMLISGTLIGVTYHYMQKTGYGVHAVFIYGVLVIGRFDLSNYSLARTGILVIVATLFSGFLFARPIRVLAARSARAEAVKA